MATAFLGLPTVSAGTLIKASDWNSMVNKIDAAIKKIMVVEKLVKTITPYDFTFDSSAGNVTGSVTLPAASTYDFVIVKSIVAYVGSTSSLGYNVAGSGGLTSYSIKIPKGFTKLPLYYANRSSSGGNLTHSATDSLHSTTILSISGTTGTTGTLYNISASTVYGYLYTYYEFYKYEAVSV